MTPRTMLAGLALSAAITAGAVSAAAAQSEPTPKTDGTTESTAAPDTADKEARKAFVCANQDRIADILSQRADLLDDRLALAQDARQAATDAGASDLVTRIDARIAKIVKAQERVETRTATFTAWVGEHCLG